MYSLPTFLASSRRDGPCSFPCCGLPPKLVPVALPPPYAPYGCDATPFPFSLSGHSSFRSRTVRNRARAGGVVSRGGQRDSSYHHGVHGASAWGDGGKGSRMRLLHRVATSDRPAGLCVLLLPRARPSEPPQKVVSEAVLTHSSVSAI